MLYFEKGCEYATYSERVRHHVANSWSFAAPMDSFAIAVLDSWHPTFGLLAGRRLMVSLHFHQMSHIFVGETPLGGWHHFPALQWRGFDFRRSERRKREETEVALKRRKDSQAAVDVPASLSSKKRHQLPPHRYVLAPMVGGSELPFRMMTRRYGTQLCYTPMIYSGPFFQRPGRALVRKTALKSRRAKLFPFVFQWNQCVSKLL